jgi:hypothetical protein
VVAGAVVVVAVVFGMVAPAAAMVVVAIVRGDGGRAGTALALDLGPAVDLALDLVAVGLMYRQHAVGERGDGAANAVAVVVVAPAGDARGGHDEQRCGRRGHEDEDANRSFAHAPCDTRTPGASRRNLDQSSSEPEPEPLPLPLDPEPLDPLPLDSESSEPDPLDPDPLDPDPLEPDPLEPDPLDPDPLDPLRPDPLDPECPPSSPDPRPLDPERSSSGPDRPPWSSPGSASPRPPWSSVVVTASRAGERCSVITDVAR